MMKAIGTLSLLTGLPIVGMLAHALYVSYYEPLKECSELDASERGACVTEIPRNIPPAPLEQIMAYCGAAERFMLMYKVNPSTRKDYSQTPEEIEAMYKASCGRPS